MSLSPKANAVVPSIFPDPVRHSPMASLNASTLELVDIVICGFFSTIEPTRVLSKVI